jgi:eukaryotic-like serine/threonine-protein kinase
MIGTTFQGFNVQKQLGRGTFGVVYEITDTKAVHWALKVFDPLPNLQVDRDELKRRFIREIRYQSAISHPNVVRIALYNVDHDPPYFIMDLAASSLLDLLRSKQVNAQNATSAITDMLTGLEAMHDAGYKHRDLKPGNVLVFSTGDFPKNLRFAISDFGLIAPPENDTSTLTATGVGGGTIDYAAPEAMKDLKRVTVRSDIYSVGAILHDIYVGQRRIPCTKLTGPGLIGKVIERCTEPNQSRRFANVAELRSAYVNAALDEQFQKNDEDADIVALLEQDELFKRNGSAKEGDRVLIVSDGVYEVLQRQEIAKLNSITTSLSQFKLLLQARLSEIQLRDDSSVACLQF